MIGGKLFRGSRGYASEVGHMTIQPEGELCGCGNRGCWETLVGPRAIVGRVQKTLVNGSDSMIVSLVGGELKCITEVTRQRRRDPVAPTRREVGKFLGAGVLIRQYFQPELTYWRGVEFSQPILCQ
jgi:predicted NBD/HSP70 family sugar kinase